VKTDDLIVELARASGPWVPLPSVRVRALRWLIVSLGLCARTVGLIGGRADLLASLRDPTFLVPAALLLCAGLTAAAAAMTLSVPGAERTPAWRMLAVVLAATWAFVVVVRLVSGGAWWPRLAAWPNHWACVAEITGLAIVSGWVLLGMLRRASPLESGWSAGLASIASAALAAAATQIICPLDDAAHLVVSHVTPVMILAAIGTLVGARALR
jgi:hypothetical protein